MAPMRNDDGKCDSGRSAVLWVIGALPASTCYNFVAASKHIFTNIIINNPAVSALAAGLLRADRVAVIINGSAMAPLGYVCVLVGFGIIFSVLLIMGV